MREETRDTENTKPLSNDFLGFGGVVRAIVRCFGFEKPSSSFEETPCCPSTTDNSPPGLVILEPGSQPGGYDASTTDNSFPGLTILEPGSETGGNSASTTDNSPPGIVIVEPGSETGDNGADDGGPIYPLIPETRIMPKEKAIRIKDPAHH